MPSNSSPCPPERAPFGRWRDLFGMDGFARIKATFVSVTGPGKSGASNPTGGLADTEYDTE